MKSTTLAELKALTIVGNAGSDMHIFQRVDAFVHNEHNTIADRAEALRWMSHDVMGCSRDEQISDKDIVQDYLDNC